MAAQKMDPEKVKAACSELAKVRDAWLARPGVTAVDVGYKLRNGKRTGQLALRAHVRYKKPAGSLPPGEVFDSTPTLRDQGLEIDVLQAEYAVVKQPTKNLRDEEVDRTCRFRPLIGGISIGGERVATGTLGAVVMDLDDGRPCILSNWHVLAGSPDAQPGEVILQPGKVDGGTAKDRVAVLKRMCLSSCADAALAQIDDGLAASGGLVALERPILGIAAPRLGMVVVKSGRTSGVTRGIVDGIALSVTLDYGGGLRQTLHGQIHIVPDAESFGSEVSLPGDSGSVWLDKHGYAVGLHFAGEADPNPASELALASPMGAVAEALRFSFGPRDKLHGGASKRGRSHDCESAETEPVGMPITEPVGMPITEAASPTAR